MFEFIAGLPAFWGFVGALISSGTRLVVCLRECQVVGRGQALCYIEALIAIVVGIAAAAFATPVVVDIIHATKDHDSNALAAMVGMLAYLVAPQVARLCGDSFIGALKRWLPGGENKGHG